MNWRRTPKHCYGFDGIRHRSRGRSSVLLAYLRVAQTYMLISMPTGTSTIFGAFQAIRVSPGIERDIAPGKT